MLNLNFRVKCFKNMMLALFIIFTSTSYAQDILIYEAKFETDAQGWTWQAYASNGNLTTSPSGGRIAGVNWALNGGTAGCIRHGITFNAGSWFGFSPLLQLEAGEEYYVKFGTTLSGANSVNANVNHRAQVRWRQSSANAPFSLSNYTILMGSTYINTTGGANGYVEMTSPILTAATSGDYRFAIGNFFGSQGWATYFDGIRIYQVNNAPLPVTLTSFNAQCEPQRVLLSWTTASEFNASHFDVEMSRDGMIWNNIGRVEAAGTTSHTSNYQFSTNNSGALTYFRLVQIDFDGASEIYGPISSVCDINKNTLVVSPNPASETFKLEIRSTEAVEKAIIQIVDMMGTVVWEQASAIQQGSNNLMMQANRLSAGTYIIRVQSDNSHFESTRIMIK
jgi:hypothetical protein